MVDGRARAPRRCSTRTCCGRWRSPATRPSFDALRALRARGAAPLVQPGGGRGAVLRLPGARLGQPRAGDGRCCSARCWPGDWAVVEAAEPRHLQGGQRPGRGLPRLAPRARAAVAGVRRALTAARGRASTRRVQRGAVQPVSSRVRTSAKSLHRSEPVQPSAARPGAAACGGVAGRGSGPRRPSAVRSTGCDARRSDGSVVRAASPIALEGLHLRVIVDGSRPNARGEDPSRCGPSSASWHMIP